MDILEISGQGLGFQEFRRDPEDPYGWRPTGLGRDCTLATYEQALFKAIDTAKWLNQ